MRGNPRLTDCTQTPDTYTGAGSSCCDAYHVARILAATGGSRSEALGLRAWNDVKLCISFSFSVYYLFEHHYVHVVISCCS